MSMVSLTTGTLETCKCLAVFNPSQAQTQEMSWSDSVSLPSH